MTLHICKAVVRSENPGVSVVIKWAKSVPLVEIGLTDLPKSGCALDKATILLCKTVDSEIISNLLEVGSGWGRIWAALELIQAIM